MTTHEAYVGKINENQIYYLMSRGFSEQDATDMIVFGFINEIVNELPLEYAIEFNRLIKMDMRGAIA